MAWLEAPAYRTGFSCQYTVLKVGFCTFYHLCVAEFDVAASCLTSSTHILLLPGWHQGGGADGHLPGRRDGAGHAGRGCAGRAADGRRPGRLADLPQRWTYRVRRVSSSYVLAFA